MKHFVFTCGDINGIGPEICLKSFNKIFPNKNFTVSFVCPKVVFLEACKLVPPEFNFVISEELITASKYNPQVTVLDIPRGEFTPGKPTKSSGKVSFESIVTAVQMAQSSIANAVITAPISKTAFKSAGIKFTGHTDLLADLTKSKKVVMTFLSDPMKCALTTIHIPFNKVSKTLTQKKLQTTIDVCSSFLKNDLGIANPTIAVLGLNPHAGEGGNIGREEINVIRPVIERQKEVFVDGPFVPDAFFGNKFYENFDLTIGMYHDQLLIPFKLINFDKGINFTAGLPIIRTSPDHGTAFDIAWKGRASESSMVSAFYWARRISDIRNKNA